MKIVSQPNDENFLSSIPANTLGRHGYDVRERVRFPSKLLTSTCRARTLSSVTTSRCRLCPSDRGKVLGNICDTPYIHATLYLLYTHRHYKCSNEGTTPPSGPISLLQSSYANKRMRITNATLRMVPIESYDDGLIHKFRNTSEIVSKANDTKL
ncbi:hypothetical protein V1478_018690 [Vespula squamosa]|uniref:Uncharacterized protein n=1 Tax=Vespula squamosa TaxID=30214 RepID=A0ABD1ZTH8_VESSQ